MKKTVLIFGLIAGIIPSTMFWIMNPTGDFSPELMKGSQLIGYITMIVAFSTVFFAVKSYRDRHLNGSIPFGKAFLIGLYISLIASVLYATSWEAYTSVLDINFAEAYQEYTKQALEKEGRDAEEIAKVLDENAAMMETYQSNFAYRFFITMMEIFPVGLIISLISALTFSIILKNKNPQTTQNQTA